MKITKTTVVEDGTIVREVLTHSSNIEPEEARVRLAEADKELDAAMKRLDASIERMKVEKIRYWPPQWIRDSFKLDSIFHWPW